MHAGQLGAIRGDGSPTARATVTVTVTVTAGENKAKSRHEAQTGRLRCTNEAGECAAPTGAISVAALPLGMMPRRGGASAHLHSAPTGVPGGVCACCMGWAGRMDFWKPFAWRGRMAGRRGSRQQGPRSRLEVHPRSRCPCGEDALVVAGRPLAGAHGPRVKGRDWHPVAGWRVALSHSVRNYCIRVRPKFGPPAVNTSERLVCQTRPLPRSSSSLIPHPSSVSSPPLPPPSTISRITLRLLSTGSAARLCAPTDCG